MIGGFYFKYEYKREKKETLLIIYLALLYNSFIKKSMKPLSTVFSMHFESGSERTRMQVESDGYARNSSKSHIINFV